LISVALLAPWIISARTTMGMQILRVFIKSSSLAERLGSPPRKYSTQTEVSTRILSALTMPQVIEIQVEVEFSFHRHDFFDLLQPEIFGNSLINSRGLASRFGLVNEFIQMFVVDRHG
jgi:hypothetical protein